MARGLVRRAIADSDERGRSVESDWNRDNLTCNNSLKEGTKDGQETTREEIRAR